MNKYVLTILSLAAVVACQTNPTNEQTAVTAPKDTVKAERAYADINGLKMYYEVHGEGKPLVLLHGSFMTIPLNWSNIIPPPGQRP